MTGVKTSSRKLPNHSTKSLCGRPERRHNDVLYGFGVYQECPGSRA